MNVATKEYVDQIKDSISLQLEDLVSYGVAIDWNNSSPELQRIGNMQLHKTLPIQSGMKGAVVDCLNKRVVYWLDENDWRFIKDGLKKYVNILAAGTYPANQQVSFDLSYNNTDNVTIDSRGLMKSASGKFNTVIYVKINGVICKVVDFYANHVLNTSHGSLDIIPEQELVITDGYTEIEWGSTLDGTEGEVMVYVPEFWIKSYIGEDDKGWVKIATQYIDETWEHQPASFIGAYRDTVLSENVSEEEYKYLGKLPPNSAVSVANFTTKLLGGKSTSVLDDEKYFIGRRGKCKIGDGRGTFRTYERNAGKEILNYFQYKNILYWLYVIEYANFNVQASYNPTLTSEGFHQGGLGLGLTTVGNWYKFNDYNPIVPNGYTNNIGNGTGIKLVEKEDEPIPDTLAALYSVRWRGIEDPFGHIRCNIDGVIIVSDYNDNPEGKAHVYVTNNPDWYGESLDNGYYTLAGLAIFSADNYIKKFALGNNAHIIPAAQGGSNLIYVCDKNTSGQRTTSYRALYLGGAAGGGDGAGLGSFYSVCGVQGTTYSLEYTGYRSILVL